MERLVAFLYILLRDHLPAGTVESILSLHVDKSAAMTYPVKFSNPHIEAYARELAGRLCGELPSVAALARIALEKLTLTKEGDPSTPDRWLVSYPLPGRFVLSLSNFNSSTMARDQLAAMLANFAFEIGSGAHDGARTHTPQT